MSTAKRVPPGLSVASALLAPGLLLGVLSFHIGGFSPEWTAIAVLVLLALLLLHATLAGRAFEGASVGLAAAGVALAGFAAWTLVSGSWSDAPARAMLEFDRVLVYLGTLLVVGLIGRTHDRARVLLAGLATAAAGVSAAAVCVWLLPGTFAAGTATGFSGERLNWPLSYWNSAGLIAALGVVWCLHFTSTLRERPVVGVLSAAAVPVCAAALFFTGSRGAVLFLGIALAIYLVAGASRGLVTGVAATAPATVVALMAASDVPNLTQRLMLDGSGDAPRALLTLVACAGSAALLRTVLLLADRLLRRARLPRPSRQAVLGTGAALVVVGTAAFVLLGNPSALEDDIREITSSATVPSDLAPTERFTRLGSNGRIDHWRAAIEGGFQADPWRGTGAGTYALLWARERDSAFTVIDAHSLYFEVLGEMGIVGLGLLVAVLLLMLGAMAGRLRGEGRTVWAALFAASAAWAVHAGLDWDWEMPAVSLWVFAAGGLALAAPAGPRHRGSAPAKGLRIGVGLACLAMALTPLSVHRSQVGLTEAVEAFASGDCTAATDAALDANDALSVRPEPFELLAYCNVRVGRDELALRMIDAAVRRDPGNWELRYGQALVRAATGRDPRSAAQAALVRNPLHPYAIAAVDLFASADQDQWMRRALEAPLPIETGSGY